MNIAYVFLEFIKIVTMIIIKVLLICTPILLSPMVEIVPHSAVYIVERSRKYHRTMTAGLHFKIPFLERVRKVSLKQFDAFPPQLVITKDNVMLQINTAIYFEVFDPVLYTYSVKCSTELREMLKSLVEDTLRNIVDTMNLKNTLAGKNEISSKIVAVLNETAKQWGITITRVEIKNIMSSGNVQEKQLLMR